MPTQPGDFHGAAEVGAAPGAGARPPTGLERVLRGMSVFTLLMTLPQVVAIWGRREAHGVSLVSWATYLLAAALWFVYGVRKRDKTIYLACVGWILLDLAIVVGAVLYG
jgi:uncharacterized protein with PQ loop repeat